MQQIKKDFLCERHISEIIVFSFSFSFQLPFTFPFSILYYTSNLLRQDFRVLKMKKFKPDRTAWPMGILRMRSFIRITTITIFNLKIRSIPKDVRLTARHPPSQTVPSIAENCLNQQLSLFLVFLNNSILKRAFIQIGILNFFSWKPFDPKAVWIACQSKNEDL